MEVFTAFGGELERSIALGTGGFTTLGGAVARVQRKNASGSDHDSESTSKSDQESVCVNKRRFFCYYQRVRRV